MGKPSGRLRNNYRIMWCDDSGAGAAGYNPPISPEKLLETCFGGLENTPVDAYVATVGPCAGYTLSYPTSVPDMEFICDRLDAGAVIGGSDQWRLAENLRHLWSLGCDPLALQNSRAHQMGIDYWLQLRMNDWHHVDSAGQVYRLIGSEFYENHPEYLIGWEGTSGWPEYLRNNLQWFQDFQHAPVRALRLEVAIEACQRYDVAGFEYDFMRCPGYFKYGQEQKHATLMTQLIRDTRSALDQIGNDQGTTLGFSVRVPNTIEGALRLGLDVPTWIREELVDIVVPSAFFAADTNEDVSGWVELVRDTPVFINPAIEEGYNAGYTQGYSGIPYFRLEMPVMQPLTRPMINAIAMRHWHNGVNGLYVFNWGNTIGTYNRDHRPALTDIGDFEHLRFKDKRYVLMHARNYFPNCFPTAGVLPAQLKAGPLRLEIDVKDELHKYADRIQRIRLLLLFQELTVADRVEVSWNGEMLCCENPLTPEEKAPATGISWQFYDLSDHLPQTGRNEVSVYLLSSNEAFRKQVPLEITDVELEIEYDVSTGTF